MNRELRGVRGENAFPYGLRLHSAVGLILMAALAVPVAAARAGEEDVPPAVRTARDRVFPSVVQIDVHAKNFSEGEKELNRSTGSGVIIDAQGHVLTNFHVAGKAEKVIVTLVNKERVHATLVGADHWTDLALLKLDPEELARKSPKLHVAVLGESSKMMVGEPVLAMGTPFGLSRTMTQGIVTNNERYFSGDTIDGYETGDFNNWLQTDAAINPGNSGGPLVNMRGEVIGINTRGISFGDGLGFAVPIDVAKQVVAQLLGYKKVTRSYVGAQLKELVDLEGHFGLEANKGVLVQTVELSSPAREADLRPEDVILSIEGSPVSARFPEELPAIRKIIADKTPGTEMSFAVKRGGKTLEMKITTVELESKISEDEREFKEWGFTARSVTQAHARKEKLPDTHGALVTGSKPATPAREAGLIVGDIIRAVNRQDVSDFASFETLYEASVEKKDKRVLVEVLRGVTQSILVLKLEER